MNEPERLFDDRSFKSLISDPKEWCKRNMGLEVDETMEHEVCPDCLDSGVITSEEDAVECHCLKARKSRRRFEKYESNIESVSPALRVEFGNTNPEIGLIPALEPKLRIHQKEYPYANSVALLGSNGSGKSHFGNWLTRVFMGRFGIGGVYLDAGLYGAYVGSMVRSARAARAMDFFDDMIIEDNILFVDDLGAELGGSKAIGRLGSILDIRMKRRASTIVTSNLSKEDFYSRYGGRLASRILSNPSWLWVVEVDAKNLRVGRND